MTRTKTAPAPTAKQHAEAYSRQPETGRSNTMMAQRREATKAPEHLTIDEVITELQISRSTFYYWRQLGKAPRCIKLPNRAIRVRRCDLDAWLDGHQEDAA